MGKGILTPLAVLKARRVVKFSSDVDSQQQSVEKRESRHDRRNSALAIFLVVSLSCRLFHVATESAGLKILVPRRLGGCKGA